MINVLVTGVGAIIGYGIIESLKMSEYEVNITGLDIYEDAVGRKWVDRFIQAPMTSDPSYEKWVKSLIVNQDIDCFTWNRTRCKLFCNEYGEV